MGIYLEKTNFKICMHPNVYGSTIYNTKTWKQSQCPLTDEWIKIWCIYIMEYNPAIKNNEKVSFSAT